MARYRFRARATGRSASLNRSGSNWLRPWCYWPAIPVHLASDLVPTIVKHAPRISELGSVSSRPFQPAKGVFIGIEVPRAWPRRRSISQAQSPLPSASALLRVGQPLYLYSRSSHRSSDDRWFDHRRKAQTHKPDNSTRGRTDDLTVRMGHGEGYLHRRGLLPLLLLLLLRQASALPHPALAEARRQR
jgi:hypothetical protein